MDIKKPNKIFTQVSDVFTFGKYEGQTIGEVIELDPDYILWLDEEGAADIASHLLERAEENASFDDAGDDWGNHNYSSYDDD